MTPQALSSCPEERLRNTVSMLCWALASVLLFRGLFQFLSSSVFQILGLSGSVELRYLVSCCTSALSVFLPVLLYLKLNRLPFSAAFPRQRVPASLGAPVILGAAGFCLFANIPANAVANLQHALGLGTFSGAAFPSSVFAQVLYAILVAVVAPLCEEFFFRGVVLAEYRQFGSFNAVMFSSLCFAMLHFSIENLPLYLFSGIMLGLVCSVCRSIFASIVLHMVSNAMSIYLSDLFIRVTIQKSGAFFVGFVLAVLFALSLIIMISRLERIYINYAKKPPTDRIPPRSIDNLVYVYLSPAFFLLIAIFVLMTVFM